MNNNAPAISNLDTYTSRMEMGVFDKLFWTEHIFEPLDKIVDFGCGDGAMLDTYRYVRHTDANKTPAFVAMDDNPDMIAAAKKRLGDNGVTYAGSLDELLRGRTYENSLLVLSSVMHEIFSGNSSECAKETMTRLFDAGFKYIAIRDMAVFDITGSQRLKKSKVLGRAYRTIRSIMPEKVAGFEKCWGRMTYKRDIIHFLLKYRYTENWDREVRENYLPLMVEDYIEMIPNNYEIVFFDTFTHPYTKYAVKRDTGIDLTEHTHIKMILRRKD